MNIGINAGRRLAKCFLTIVCAAGIMASQAHADQCQIRKFAEFPITMQNLKPLMTAKINDTEVRLIVDSGAFYSTLSAADAAALKLKTTAAPAWFYVRGVNGAASVSFTKVDSFTLAGATLHGIEFIVGGTDMGMNSVGLLGQNFLHLGDAEYDLGQGMVRLFQPENCSKTTMAYWVKESESYSEMEITQEPAFGSSGLGSRIPPKKLQLSHTLGRAYINGISIHVMFDSGAATSILSTSAAARAGIKPDMPGAVRGGSTYGLGKSFIATYIVPVSSFKVGDEEIKNTKLRIGDIELAEADMLLGADFFLSHRIFVSNSQRKLYFTYNGGPVFNLSTASRASKDPTADAAAPPTPDASSTATATGTATTTTTTEDAADLARRGAAFASRQELDQALTALTRACELAPENAGYAYQRGMLYWQLKQGDAAKVEFDRALSLSPDDLRTLVARAELTFRNDKEGAAAALDHADLVAPKESDSRLQMAGVYQRLDRLPSAIAQLTLWIDAHGVDARLPSALNSRCFARAFDNVDLPLALKDCNAALGHAAKASIGYAHVADSRALVYLRMGNYDKSISDYDASLKINPKNAWSLYGRGIDKLRKHDTTAGNDDLASATALSPKVADEFKTHGIVP